MLMFQQENCHPTISWVLGPQLGCPLAFNHVMFFFFGGPTLTNGLTGHGNRFHGMLFEFLNDSVDAFSFGLNFFALAAKFKSTFAFEFVQDKSRELGIELGIFCFDQGKIVCKGLFFINFLMCIDIAKILIDRFGSIANFSSS